MPAASNSSNSPAMPDQQDSSRGSQTCFLDVVDLVLLHSDLLRGVRDFCRLLQTHKAVAAAAARHCHGRLEFPLSIANITIPERAAAAVPWLARHGQGIAELSITCRPDASSCPAAVARAAAAGQAVAQALRQAAAQQPGRPAAHPAAGLLQLRSLHLRVPPAVAADVLPVAGRQLSRLDLFLLLAERPDEAAAVAGVAAAVAALPGLQQLCLGFRADIILKALSSSSSLTCLDVRQLQDGSLLQCVPSQLQSLTVRCNSSAGDNAAGVQLQHCTGLSKLAFHGMGSVPLASGDVLPVSLQQLQLHSTTTLQPLVALTRLRTLGICDPPAAVELRKLTCLTNLTHISLAYDNVELGASSAAWPVLPALRDLGLVFVAPYSENVVSIAHLAKATSLTSLRLWFQDWAGDEEEDAGGAIAALAAALSSLTNLQDLFLKREAPYQVGDENAEDVSAPPHPDLVAGWPSLLAAIKGLPRLHPDARVECEWFGQELQEELDRREWAE